VREVVQSAYAAGIAELFLIAAPLGLLAFAAIALIREVPLGQRSGIELAHEATGHGGDRAGVATMEPARAAAG
jgi:hypothetical protein